MKNTKTVLALALTLMFLLVTFVGCENKPANNERETGKEIVSYPGYEAEAHGHSPLEDVINPNLE